MTAPLVPLGYGRNRLVLAHGKNYVVKIPLNDEGEFDNLSEARISRKYGKRADPDGVQYARCRLLKNGWLLMERVSPARPYGLARPGWIDFIDCGQVGRARDGRLVAYDYGYY